MIPVVLDGAMGTALMAAGLDERSLPEQWLLERPEAIVAVHRAHADAGAQVVTSCSFSLAGVRLDRSGLSAAVPELARRAVEAARRGAPAARIAGAVGPAWLGDGVHAGEWRERHGRAFRALSAAGADLLWVEGAWRLDEAFVALAEARATGLPVLVTFGFREDRGILRAGSGEAAMECLRAAAAAGAVAVGASCSLPGAPLAPLVAEASRSLGVGVVAKPSAGLPGAVIGPAPFGAWIGALLEAGARWVGGCCGATPAHLAACALAAARTTRS